MKTQIGREDDRQMALHMDKCKECKAYMDKRSEKYLKPLMKDMLRKNMPAIKRRVRKHMLEGRK